MKTKQTLYQYCAIWHPSEKEAEAGTKSQIILELGSMLSNDQNSALLAVARKVPEKYVEQLDQVEILIRPF